MNLRDFLIGCALLGALGWWISSAGSRGEEVADAAVARPGCPLPPAVASGEPPLQSDVPGGLSPFVLDAASLRPLAGFSIEARVLSREDYRIGREADLSPTDLALGWQRMAEDGVLSGLEVSQSSRWYRYRWRDQPPLPPREIARSSANMHMIPASAAVAEALAGVEQGDEVRIDGWLVEASTTDGWRWRSSTTRTDTGGGSCEVVYVCSLQRR
ncbi:MAG: hypothetical protein EOP91_06035 [Lysobacteraceae bacterium]|nr:MAG: hypothetical protein EOP91_06035 [Xanthomonadaceae bacterium]